ncbi:hypothetical protein CAPTEDRAFT_129802 [Capitella teleta]|uniref:FAM20 C-terminal domain-containing protein n=1 Tax=Capitella teleta TaxID=283909 RepID=R7V1I6_CAPTE|nr:hypothetical protein CAPTEDRAFT_129802 [Capitella teleta]|eukprot:ELU12693.1 hypothetical protein CAPTEDRAFT_129802 [Capitella teleta]
MKYKSPLDPSLFESEDDHQKRVSSEDVVQRALRFHQIWSWADDVINRSELFQESPEVEEVIKALAEARIVHVETLNLGEFESGTSEKWLVTLEGGQKAIMKILWWKGKMKPDAMCNYGYEMPSSEIAAFHLHRILGFRNTPYVSGRTVDLRREIYPVASPSVSKQILLRSGETCVIGKCYYCKSSTTLCPHQGKVEVSMAYWINRKLTLHTQPPWSKVGFNNKTYCKNIRKTVEPYQKEQAYFDLFDFAVLDTLMFHYDSKHYEITDDSLANGMTVRLDHGRALCASDRDEIDVFLAPIFQCCTIRQSTFQKLHRFTSAGSLGRALKDSLQRDPLAPILSKEWFAVFDRRLKVVNEMLDKCAKANGGLDKILVLDSQ